MQHSEQIQFKDLFQNIWNDPDKLAILSFLSSILLVFAPLFFIIGYDSDVSPARSGSVSGYNSAGLLLLLPIIGYGFAAATRYINSLGRLCDISAQIAYFSSLLFLIFVFNISFFEVVHEMSDWVTPPTRAGDITLPRIYGDYLPLPYFGWAFFLASPILLYLSQSRLKNKDV